MRRRITGRIADALRRVLSGLGALGIAAPVGLFLGAAVAALGLKAIVLVPAAVGAFAMLLIPNSALYAIIATTPINVELFGPITVSRLMIVFGFGVIMVQAFRGQIKMPRAMIWPDGTFATFFFVWIAIASVAVSPSGLLERLGPYIIYAAILFVLLNYADTPGKMRNIFVLLVVMGTMQAVLVLAEAFFGFSPFGGWHAELANDSVEDETRVVGTSSHPIILAGFFQVVMVSSVLVALTSRGALTKLLFLGLIAVALVAWWYTFARSSWVGMTMMGFFAMFFWSRPTRVLAIVGGIVGFCVLAAFDFSPGNIIRWVESIAFVRSSAQSAGVAAGTESFSWRTENWMSALRMWVDHPIFGVGLDTSPRFTYEYLPPGSLGHQYITPAVPHNIFILILAEAGIVSLVLFLSLFVLAFRGVVKAWKYPELYPFAMALAVIYAGQLGTFFLNPLPRELFLTLGLGMALGQMARRRDEAAAEAKVDAARVTRLDAAGTGGVKPAE